MAPEKNVAETQNGGSNNKLPSYKMSGPGITGPGKESFRMHNAKRGNPPGKPADFHVVGTPTVSERRMMIPKKYTDFSPTLKDFSLQANSLLKAMMLGNGYIEVNSPAWRDKQGERHIGHTVVLGIDMGKICVRETENVSSFRPGCLVIYDIKGEDIVLHKRGSPLGLIAIIKHILYEADGAKWNLTGIREER